MANPHHLTAFAIGLAIEGMTRQQLLDTQSVWVDARQSGTGAHPECTAFVPPGYVLVSGGFRGDWHGAGNLATASFPETNFSWKARSKDHSIPDPANLWTFAIGLKEILPVGRIVSHIQVSPVSGQVAHPASTCSLPPGFAMTGGGAEVRTAGPGNLLWKLEPATRTDRQDFSAA